MPLKDFESDNSIKNKSLAISLLVHAVLIFFVLYGASLKYDFPPPGKEGILVMFGDTPESTGHEDKQMKSDKGEKNMEEKEKKQEVVKEKPVKIEKTIKEEKSEVLPETDKNKSEEKSLPQKKERDAKEEFSKLFRSRGTKKSGKGLQGDPLGSKDAEILEGITRGKGKIGEGLDSRGILYEPVFSDSSQKSGKVVVKVCINEKGNVVSSRYTQRGSTTTDTELIEIAVGNAKKYRFTPSDKKLQCGTITIEFIVK